MRRDKESVKIYAGALCACLLVAVAQAPAFADTGQTSAGLDVIFVHGQHAERTGSVETPLVPAPILRVSHRTGRVELIVEAIPPLGTYPIHDNVLGMQDIALSYGEGDLRYWNRSGRFALGIGETLYNQRTHYVNFSSPQLTLGEYDASRVTGAQYEAVERVPIRPNDVLEATLQINPSLHGRLTWTEYSTSASGTHSFDIGPGWESGSQAEAALQLEHRTGPWVFRYGLRYLNYVAHFNDGVLADRNTFLMPFVGASRNLGR